MKIKKKSALIILGVVWLLALSQLIGSWKSEKDEEADIVTAFASGEYIETNGEVSAYVNYGNKYLSDEDRDRIIKDIAKALGIDGEIDVDIQRNESKNGYSVTASYTCMAENARTDISIITIESISETAMMSLEQYILVDISIDNSVESAVYYKESVEKYFKQIGADPDVTLSLKGSVSGALSNNEKNKICEEVLEALGGKLITGSRSDELYTVYAYSDSIDEYVVNGTTKSNINIAITYDNINDVSWVYVATPILNDEF